MSGLSGFYLSTLALLAPMITFVLVGTVWGKKQLPFSREFLTTFVMSVTTPALVFSTLYATQLDNATLLDIGLASVLALVVAHVACGLALRLLGLPVRGLMMTAAFPNAGNLGLPLSKLAFGDAGLSAAVVFFAICTFLHTTIGIRTLPDVKGNGAAWRSPVLLAALLALVMRLLDIPVPEWTLESARAVGALTVPLMLMSLGYALYEIPSGGMRTGSVLAFLRLTLGIACAWLVTFALGISGPLSGIIMLQMSMPCAVSSYIFTARYTNHAGVAAGAVLVSTVAFLLLAPLVLILVGASPIPP